MNIKKKQIAIALGSIVVLGAAFGAGAVLSPKEVIVTKEVAKYVEVPGEIQYVDKVVEKTIVKEVAVDNGNLELVLAELQAKDGDVEYLTEGIDKDEIELIVDRLIMTQEWEALAFNKTKSRLYDELHKEVINGTTLYSDDMRSLYIEVDDIEFENIDFTDKDADVLVPFRFRQDEDKFEGVARILIRENEVDDIVVDSISKQ
jgi:hypothetical protein